MWQHWQNRIKEEAKKFGYGKKQETLNEESNSIIESVSKKLSEGGVKAALEDFMYDMLPKQAIAELKPIMKNQSIRGADLRNKVASVLKKHKVPLMHLGGSSAQLVIDYFDTFHGESVEVNEDEWGGGFQTSADAQRGVQAGLKGDYNRERNQKLKLVVQVIRGEISKQKFKKLAGISYDQLMDPTFKNWYVNQVKKMPKKALAPVAKAEDVEVDEAYAPLDTPGIIGAFTEATKKNRFEYRNSTDSWGKSHGLPHEVCISQKFTSKMDWRAANVKGTVCYIAVDEDADGKPVLEKWTIRNHVKYVKAESIEMEVDEAFNPADHGFRIDKDGDKFIVYKLSMNQGSIRFPDGRKGTVIGRYGTKDEALAAAKRNAGVKEEVEDGEAVSENHMCGCAGDGKKIQKKNKDYKQAVAQKIGEEIVRPTLGEVQRHLDSQMQPHAEARINNTQHVFGVTDIEITEDGTVKSFKWNGETVSEGVKKDEWKSITEGAFEEAMVLAKQIVAEAKKRGVSISVDSSTSISFSKKFPEGNRDAFFDALRDCTTIRSMVRFKKRVNEWGASMAGSALGAQSDLKAGRVTIHKSGDGAAYLLKALDKIA